MSGLYDLPGYDAWKTSPPPEPEGACPGCGLPLDGCEQLDDELWECPQCGTKFTDDEAQRVHDLRDDEPHDFDERRFQDED